MKRLLYIIIFACALALPLEAMTPSAPVGKATVGTSSKSNEQLTYNIYFHMGFIWAKAGLGKLDYRLETQKDGTKEYHGQLAAKSLSIVEHLMKVRDTLDCWFDTEMVPTRFVKSTHEGSYNCVAHNTYRPFWKKNAANTLQNVDSTQVTIDRWKKKGKDPMTREVIDFSNQGVAYDMLSVFYSIRRLDYAKMTKGKKMTFVCYDGNKCQDIHVEYCGAESCELRDGTQYDAYLVYLTFATKGQESTPLKVWLAKTDDHRPVKAVIALNRIGSVQCEIVE